MQAWKYLLADQRMKGDLSLEMSQAHKLLLVIDICTVYGQNLVRRCEIILLFYLKCLEVLTNTQRKEALSTALAAHVVYSLAESWTSPWVGEGPAFFLSKTCQVMLRFLMCLVEEMHHSCNEYASNTYTN